MRLCRGARATIFQEGSDEHPSNRTSFFPSYEVTEEKTVDDCFFKDVTEIRRNEVRLCRARISTIFQEARETRDPFEGKKEEKQKNAPQSGAFFVVRATNYLFENWGARRAPLRPYFFLSFIRGSRVKKPAFLRAGLFSASAATRARAIP